MKIQMKQSVALVLAFLLLFTGCSKQGNNGNQPDGEYDQSGKYFPNTPDVSAQLQEAQKANTDVIAWLSLPNTKVDEAVVQTTNNEFYLRRDVKKNYAYEGCYYMDYESVILDDGKDLAQNTIIYGHNLGSPMGVRDDPEGVKFAQLLKLNDEELARKTPYLYLTTDSGPHTFEIFAAFYCEAETEPVPYHHAEYPEEQFTALVKDAQDRSTFTYDVKVKPNDRIITLSTCSYKYGTYTQNPHQRYVVMGRLVKDGDKYHEQADIKVNKSPKMPPYAK